MSLPFPLPRLLDGRTVPELSGMPFGHSAGQWLSGHPELVGKMMKESLSSGVQLPCAPTFAAGFTQLREFGLSEQVESVNQAIFAAARNSVPENIPLGASLSPSGIFLAPGGETDFDDVYDGYREQVRVLDEAGAAFFHIADQDCLSDMRAAVLAARTTNLPVLVTIRTDRNGCTVSGGGLLPALITLQAMDVDAVGICGSLTAEEMTPFLRELLPHASLPLIAVPSPGTLSPEEFGETAKPLLLAGVGIAGSGQDSSPAHTAALRRALDEAAPSYRGAGTDYADADSYAAASEREAFFLGDDIVWGEPIECSSGLGDDLIDLDDEQVNAALIRLESLDDVELLLEHGSMSKLPIAVQTDQRTILDAALRYYQGRLIVDSNCEIDKELIDRLAVKYGAIVY